MSKFELSFTGVCLGDPFNIQYVHGPIALINEIESSGVIWGILPTTCPRDAYKFCKEH